MIVLTLPDVSRKVLVTSTNVGPTLHICPCAYKPGKHQPTSAGWNMLLFFLKSTYESHLIRKKYKFLHFHVFNFYSTLQAAENVKA